MSEVKDLFSIYIALVMLGIGAYMFFWQSKYLNTVDHLPRESAFTKILGGIYLVVAVASFVILLQ